ncbi:MAG: Rieske 2Fe-2S domain-containing protein [Bacteroidia bacterium]
MKRKTFIKNTCRICVGSLAGVSIVSLFDSCASGKILKKDSLNDTVQVLESEFEEDQEFVIVRTSSLNFDLFLHKNKDNTYQAFLMQCTHYDNPIFANKKELFCPSHGSTFDFQGKVNKEPATRNLKEYKTVKTNTTITIYLK